MRLIATIALLALLAPLAVAHDLGPARPDKPAVAQTPPPVDTDLLRQGGDTIADAVEIPMIHTTSGTTAGYTDDYDEVCPYDMSTSPDVVYTFVADGTGSINVDLYGSAYDTKVYLYDESLNLVACNDDYYPDYVSLLSNVPVTDGVRYYLVVDGYGGDYGDYELAITYYDPCVLDCPAGFDLEGEPPLQNDQDDVYNGGCSVIPPLLQHIPLGDFCGVSGWYLYQGSNYRDTDWFTVNLPQSGFLSIFIMAEQPTYLFELGPQDCNEVGVLQNVGVEPCVEGEMILVGDPGALVWIWVGPQTFGSPDETYPFEYDYFLMMPLPVVVEEHTLSDVKALFR